MPIVFVSVNGRSAEPFVVDTVASISVITPEEAARVGIRPTQGAEILAHTSSSRRTEGWLARADLALDALSVHAVEVAVLDFPLEGIAGVSSPQSVLPGHATALDLRSFSMRIARQVPGR